MKNKYNYVYIAAILGIILILFLVKDINDMVEMGLYASAIILTSIFTYSNRKKRQDLRPSEKEELANENATNGSKE